MTTEQTITIHHEPPPDGISEITPIMAYWVGSRRYHLTYADIVKLGWGTDFTAWYDPQIGEPVKARRYVVADHITGPYMVEDRCYSPTVVIASNIPTREAAQAIADIYERAAEGGAA